MPEEFRPARCTQYARNGADECPKPPAWEVLGPAPMYLCKEHARERAELGFDEGWIQFGEARYLKMCEEADEALRRMPWKPERGARNPALEQCLEEALQYLTVELERARRAYVAVGGKPRPTSHELERMRTSLRLLGGEW